jgi:hypothetical protein
MIMIQQQLLFPVPKNIFNPFLRALVFSFPDPARRMCRVRWPVRRNGADSFRLSHHMPAGGLRLQLQARFGKI